MHAMYEDPCLFKWPHPQARQRALQAAAGWLEHNGRMDLIEAQLPRPCHIYKAIFTRPFTRQILAGVFGLGFLSMDARAPLCTIKEVYSTHLLYQGGPWGDTHGYNYWLGLLAMALVCYHQVMALVLAMALAVVLAMALVIQETTCTNKLLQA
jgi:hypothetical protein